MEKEHSSFVVHHDTWETQPNDTAQTQARPQTQLPDNLVRQIEQATKRIGGTGFSYGEIRMLIVSRA